MEVSDLALRHRAGRKRGIAVEVDLPRLRRALARKRPEPFPTLWVGHLAHFLPVDAIVLLRCHPIELARRLRSARRGSRQDQFENVTAEAVDLLLIECQARGIPLWEVDTSGRSAVSVARTVRTLLRTRPASRFGRVDWLRDRHVTDLLLRPGP